MRINGLGDLKLERDELRSGLPTTQSEAGVLDGRRSLPKRGITLKESRAFTLPEVLMASALSAVIFGSLVYGYLQSLKRAEWSAYSLAAHSLAMQGLELARAAKWDPQAWPPVDEISATNYVITTNILDIPISETNFVFATNYIAIQDLSIDPPLKLIRVDSVWMFMGQGPFTNTAVVYRSPDQ